MISGALAALSLAIFSPFLICFGFFLPRWRSLLIKLAPIGALPAFLLAVLGAVPIKEQLPWMLLGTSLELDATGKVFLFFTSILWGVSGFYGVSYLSQDEGRSKFTISYLLAMCGNFGLILVQDIVSFYFFFGLMSFASYGLIVHDRTSKAYYAGSLYLWLVVVGEVLIFSGLVLTTKGVANLPFHDFTALLAASPRAPVITGLLLFGFGIKAGALPLHVWLPLAHPAAPAPASAILSGAMIKAGLLGWLRFLPIGEIAIPAWGPLFVILGLLAAYYAVIVGITQDSVKTILAYSSISQMGLMTTAVGAAMAIPDIWPGLWIALMIFAPHHALAKGVLFLSTGTSAKKRKILWTAAFVLPAIVLVGAPFTSGALAKVSLKWALKQGLPAHPWLKTASLLVGTSALGTLLLLARFCWLMMNREHLRPKASHAGVILPWGLLLATSLLLPFITKPLGLELPESVTFYPHSVFDLWPFFAGGAIVWMVLKAGWQMPFRVPEGDLLPFYLWLGRFFSPAVEFFRRLFSRDYDMARALWNLRPGLDTAFIDKAERTMGLWKVFGMAFVSLTLVMVFLFVFGARSKL